MDDNDRDVMTDSTLEFMKARELKAKALELEFSTLEIARKKLEVQSTRSKGLLILFSLSMTLVMIGTHVALKDYGSGTSSVGIITSFLAGMFGYATLEFLGREFQKI